MNYIKRILAYFPSRLPVGLTEFHAWADSIVSMLPPGFEKVPKDELEWVLASTIQHLGMTKAYVSKQYFVQVLHKAAASQVAAQVFQDIKLAQVKAKEAADAVLEEAKKLEQSAEATAEKVLQTVEATTESVVANVEKT